MSTMKLSALAAAAFLAKHALAGNPIVPNVGMADPHVHFFNGTFYVYSTHDYSPNNTGFRMDDWWVWSSPDMVAWTQECVLLPQDTPAPSWAYQDCWATDAAFNGTHYAFYLSTGPTLVAVMISETPVGPWQNVLGAPLLNSTLANTLKPSTEMRDPCAFRDDDGTLYLLFGTFNYFIARMEADMVTLAEYPLYVTVLDALGPFGFNKTDDKPFMHKYNGTYYLSWGAFYGTGSSPYGPFTYMGTLTNTSVIDPAFRTNSTYGEWYTWEDLEDRHGSVWTAHGQSYWSSNDRSHSSDKANNGAFRDTVLGYLSYYTNGSIAPVAITTTGVGQYEGGEGWQAEHYTKVGGRAHKTHDEQGRFSVHMEDESAVLEYPNIRGVSERSVLRMRASNGGSAPAALALYTSTDVHLCDLTVPPTGAWEDGWQDFTCAIHVPAAPVLHLVVRLASAAAVRIDEFSISGM